MNISKNSSSSDFEYILETSTTPSIFIDGEFRTVFEINDKSREVIDIETSTNESFYDSEEYSEYLDNTDNLPFEEHDETETEDIITL